MKEFKGTPGPWLVTEIDDDDLSEKSSTMIAAASELLEAVIKCVDALDEVSSQQWCGPIIDEARAAISKALGESQ